MKNELHFSNSTQHDMTFEDVVSHMEQFIASSPDAAYLLSIGTDAQVYPGETEFATGIILRRIKNDCGQGAWCAIHKQSIKRPIHSLHEKISLETSMSQHVASHFTPDVIERFVDILIPYIDQGAQFDGPEIHLDIGERGLTRSYIQEMVSRIKAMGLEARIKPDAYAASNFADRYVR
ncbi:ribonuclease H-like YkuK family protein [Alkalibacillus aidingensis]|uniref:ribonuclease H-like YkuK family protein n=1 Tax=Alkalibacillus aidingensis TaxID=2747607 RepID=UPI00166027CD|nr:ribonuclease H-like YkuK family protein [Alkalibacillus aidingensis]